MREVTVLPFVFALISLGGCDIICPATDCSTCPPAPVDCSTCAPPAPTAYDPRWDVAAATLLSEVAAPLPGSGVGSTQVLDGELGLTDSLTNQPMGLIFAQKTTDQADPMWTEQWILYSYQPATSYNTPFNITAISATRLGSNRMNQLRAAEAAALTDYKLASQLAEYRVFPTDAKIDALIDGMPPNTVNVTFTVKTVSLPSFDNAAYLYREVHDWGGYHVWTDHWVYTDKYKMVDANASAQATLFATQYADLQDFMVAMKGLHTGPQANLWRYQQVSYGWHDL